MKSTITRRINSPCAALHADCYPEYTTAKPVDLLL